MQAIDCKLTILDGEDVEYLDSLGREAEGKVLRDDLTMLTIDRVSHWVANYDTYCRREDLRLLGLCLYTVLFNGAVREEFEKTYNVFKEQKANDKSLRLRLSLVFHKKAKDLPTYPWEFICMQTHGSFSFLAGEETQLILTRYVPESEIVSEKKPDELKPEERPLRILIVSVQPRELDTTDPHTAVTEIENIVTGIRGLQPNPAFHVEYLENPTFDELDVAITNNKPHIFHFIGHGEEGKIALMKDPETIAFERAQAKDGRVDEAAWIDSITVKNLFTDHQPRLVFLHSCKGAASQLESPSLQTFNSTARELVYANIPVVVAMQYDITNPDALDFAKTFYQQISQGKLIDEAVQAGRQVLGKKPPSWNHRRFGTPVVYLQTKNRIMTEMDSSQEDTSQTIPPEASPAGKVPCPNSDCQGWVDPSQKRCLKCRHTLMKCPECGHVMSMDMRGCGFCEYELKAAPAAKQTTVQEGTASVYSLDKKRDATPTSRSDTSVSQPPMPPPSLKPKRR
jgi:hypothetical protein